jgi:hypothetical protein
LVPAANIINRNFMVANYGSNGGCVDNDDGSSFYNITNNFFVFGGHKSDFNGHSKLSWGNVNVYPTARCSSSPEQQTFLSNQLGVPWVAWLVVA